MLRRLSEGLESCGGWVTYTVLLRDLLNGMRTLHDKVTSFIKKQKHYRKEQLRDFLLNYRLRFRRLWSVVEATVEVIGLELGQQPLRA